MQTSGRYPIVDPHDIAQAIRCCTRFDYIHIQSSDQGSSSSSPAEPLSLSSPLTESESDPVIGSYLTAMSEKVEKTRSRRSRNDAQNSSSMITRDMMQHIVVIQALSAAHPDFDFPVWADQFADGTPKLNKKGQAALDRIGIDEAYTEKAYHLYVGLAVQLFIDIKKVSNAPGAEEYARLKPVFNSAITCHRLVVTDEFAEEGQICHVTQNTPKAKQRLSIFEMTVHSMSKNRATEEHSVKQYPVSYVLCERFVKLCYAFWYLVHAEDLVGAEYLAWKDKRDKADSKFRSEYDPVDAVNTFAKENMEFIDDMHRKILNCYDVVLEERKLFDRGPGANLPKDE